MLAAPIIKRLNILLVEDNPINHKVMCAFLAQDQHNVTLAENGKTAINICQTNTFDVILLDMRLPDMSGMDVYKEVTQDIHHLNRHTRFIAVTANILETEIDHYHQLGISLLVSKPVSQQVLREALFYSQQPDNTMVLHSLDTENILETKNTHLSASSLFDPEPLSWLQNAVPVAELAQYLQQLPTIFAQQIKQVQVAYKQNERDNFEAILHKVTGAAAQVGLRRLAKISGQMEKLELNECSLQQIEALDQLCKISLAAQQQALE